MNSDDQLTTDANKEFLCFAPEVKNNVTLQTRNKFLQESLLDLRSISSLSIMSKYSERTNIYYQRKMSHAAFYSGDGQAYALSPVTSSS